MYSLEKTQIRVSGSLLFVEITQNPLLQYRHSLTKPSLSGTLKDVTLLLLTTVSMLSVYHYTDLMPNYRNIGYQHG